MRRLALILVTALMLAGTIAAKSRGDPGSRLFLIVMDDSTIQSSGFDITNARARFRVVR